MSDLIRKICPDCAQHTQHTLDGVCLQCEHERALEMKALDKAAKEPAKKQPKKRTVNPESKAKRAQAELAKRELARRNLLPFIMRYEPTYKAGWFHKLLCKELEEFLQAVLREESPRLIITVPPRHGKSLVASQYFPAWAVGNHPHLEFINTSYAQSLQMDFSRKIQELVRQPDYKLLFDGLQIAKGNEAIERWSLADKRGVRTGGGILAQGVGGPITGRGAHIFLIDDPVKNRDEAESPTIRETAKSWYSSTAYTRLAPGAGIIVIQTRWHDDDLTGHLLSQMEEAEKEMQETGEWPDDADRWKVLNFPAIATEDEPFRKEGEALHAERYDIKALRKIKRTLAPRDWAALYQQTPQVDEGAYFSKKMVRYYESNPPRHMDIYAAGDLAIGKSEQADFCVFLVCGMDEAENIYMLDEYRGRAWDTDKIIDVMFEIHKKWKPRRFGLEKGHISLTVEGPFERRKRDENMIDLHIEELKPGKNDKLVRARSIQGLMSLGKVYWPAGALWVPDYINELMRFPNGVKDDRVDAAAWIGRMLANQRYIGTGRPKRKDKSWRKKLAGYVSKQKTGGKPYMAA